ncbi:hypothetical protein H074_00020, partial [Amycolatopsis decaplanina DSM 44594]
KPVEPGMRGYFGRMLTNSVEAWADRSSRRHRRRKMWQAARQEHNDSEWLRKKIARTEKRAARAERWAAKRGVIWDKTKAAATAHRDENAARDASTAHGGTEPVTEASQAPPRPGPPPAPEPPRSRPEGHPRPEGHHGEAPPPGPSAGVPFGAGTPNPGSSPRGGAPRYGRPGPTAGSESEGWTEYDEPIVHNSDRYRFRDGRFFDPAAKDAMRRRPAPEQQDPAPIRAEGEIVRDTPAPPPEPLQLEAGPSTGSPEILDAEVVEDSPAPAENSAGNPTAPMEDATMTASAEITNLPAAKAYTAKMTEYLNTVKGIVESQKAELSKLAEDFQAELSDAELAMSSLQSHGFTGGPVAEFQLANEQLSAMQQALSDADRALSP